MQYATSAARETTTFANVSAVSTRLFAGARALGAVVAFAAALAGCSGGSGPAVEQNPGGGGGQQTQSYNGPAPNTPDVQSFKINLWDNIRPMNRCGTCHSVEGGQTPMFARSDDVNLAYAAANGVVTLTSPKDSLMVQKVGGGHNCWLASNSTCATILTTWITNWAGELANSSGRTIQLEPPTLRDPGASKNYPDDQGLLYSTTVYPLTAKFCSGCHSSSSAVKQQPFFAEGGVMGVGPSSDPNTWKIAYEAAKPKMDLDDPANSRLVLRLRNESHNCWTSSCATDADNMQAKIQAFADAVAPTQVDPNLKTSKALTLYEGTVASGGHRYESSMVSLYEFKSGTDCGDSITGACATAYDTSGVDGAGVDLHLSGNVKWMGGWGLNFAGGKAQATTAASAKLTKLIQQTGEYSIEAWVAPGNVVQEDMRIVSYSGGTMARNFNLGQTMYNYDFFNRSSTTDQNGEPGLSTPNAAQVLQATLQHVVATFDPVAGRKIYVNGALKASMDPTPGGTLNEWDDTFAFVLGNEVSGTKNWMGVIRLVAIFNRALTLDQIKQNFDAGVGEKYFLMFSVEHLTNIPQSYVVFEGSQFDSYSYLFRKPFFISLDGTAQPAGLDIDGIRIGLNGAEAPVGQSYANLTKKISSAYTAGAGERLTDLGAVLPLEKGPSSDEFFLTFDTIGANTFNRPPPETPPPPTAQDLPPASDIGVRTFDEIDATLSTITGVSQLDPGVKATFDEVRQSLPAIPSIEAFLSSHQASIAQLAIEYCNAMVNNIVANPAGPIAQRFAGFPFTQGTAVAWPGAGATEDAFIDPLLDRVLGTAGAPIATAPDRATVKAELTTLVHGGHAGRPGLVAMVPATDAARTQTIAKAVCAAAVGNGAALVQ
jgi:hypothetical protein